MTCENCSGFAFEPPLCDSCRIEGIKAQVLVLRTVLRQAHELMAHLMVAPNMYGRTAAIKDLIAAIDAALEKP